VWATCAEDTKRMGVKKMKCITDVYGVSIKESVRNEEVLRRCSSEVSIKK
jgi:hypothetical protein